MNKASDNKVKFAVIGLLTLIAAVFILYATTSTRPFGEPYKNLSDLGGNFTLTTSGGTFSLTDIKGKVGILYFGFLNCDDACPASISVVRSAFKKLSEEERQQVQFVYISVDPERDTEAKLKHFSHMYNDDLIALTGSKEQIDEVTSKYGVYFDIQDLEGNVDQYVVDHSSRFYLIDQQGTLTRAMSHSTTPTELAARLKEMLTTSTTGAE